MNLRALALFVGLVVLLVGSAAGLRGATPTERPNILWLTSEDNNVDWVGSYGNPLVDTPNIDRLAREGFRYLHAYANAPVCAPSRSTWITGVYALSTGTHQMRSRYVIPHDRLRYYPDLLRERGYYTGNSTKTDYNIGGRNDGQCWDNPKAVRWEELARHQPFFQVVNFGASHESRAQGDVSQTIHDPAQTKLPAFHPDLPDIRATYAKYHDAVQRMDADVGEALRRLEELGLADDTIVIYNSDHGGVLPLSKRYLFRTGLHCPLIMRIPDKFRHLWPAEAPGMTVDRLVSFIDMPKTWLSLTGSEVPPVMQGKIFLGEQAEPEPPFHYAFRGRMDERIDNARAVTDKRFIYIRNYLPMVPWIQHLTYQWLMKATVAWEEQVKSGRATEVQARYFQPKGWTEELYDTQVDPDCVTNLAADPAYAERRDAMRAALRAWQLEIHDSGLWPETEMERRAAAAKVTIYDLVRDPAQYDLPALLDAADLALEQKPANLPRLRAMQASPDLGLRYWGTMGGLQLNDLAAGHAALADPSHEVRALGAWLLIRAGEKEPGLAALEELLREESYAILSVLNIIELIGDDAQSLRPVIAAATYDREAYPTRMQEMLLAKFPAVPEPDRNGH